MDKKKPKKPKIRRRTPSKAADKSSQALSPEKDTDEFDFGGLPNRDLKRNLGCG